MLTRFYPLVLIIAACAALGGGYLAGSGPGRATAQDQAQRATLAAERFRIVNAQGHARAELLLVDGYPQANIGGIELQMTEAGPALRFVSGGRLQAVAALVEGGRPVLRFYDHRQTPRLLVSLRSDGSAYLHCRNAEGGAYWKIP